MSERAVEAVAALLGARIGLRAEGAARARLSRVVREGAARRRLGADAYAGGLAGDDDELQRVIDRVTVQETGFFREPAHFRALVEEVLPGMPGGATIWSAGCANGQEAWSLAMALEEAARTEWRVVATDVAARAVARARSGTYSERELAGLSPERRLRFLRPARDGRFEVVPRLLDRVVVLPHNLVAEPPPPAAGECRVVFCRNVLIYLRPEATRRVLAGLRQRMPADGHLFLGASETLVHGNGVFVAEHFGDGFAYRPAAPGTAPRADTPDVLATPAPAPAPRPARRPARRPPAPPLLPSPADLAAEGERLAATGDHTAAAAAFRKAAYLAPDDPLAHLRLGLSLERAGERRAAVRAFRAGRAALERGNRDTIAAALEGWSVDELERLLDDKLQRAAHGTA